jgi:poly(A) polymerase
MNKRMALQIIKKLRSNGFQSYFVGGCVRDMVMHKAPKDFDIATDAKITQIRRLFPKKSYAVGAQFGTVLVVRRKIPFQISTFRSRSRKKNHPLSILEDVSLRDFTINGLAYDPIEKKIIDLVGAKRDIRKKKICAIGDDHSRFTQDPLRLIRAVRFAVTLGFKIDSHTLRVIKKMAPRIKKASAERIRDELISIFTSLNPSQGLKLLDETGLLKQVLPQIDKLKGVQQPRAFHPEGDVYKHTLLMLKQLKNPSLVLAFACLLHDIGKPATFKRADRIRFSGHDRVGAQMSIRLLKKFRFSNRDREDIVACVENHMRIMEAPKMRAATLKRLLSRPTFKEELILHRVDCIASHKDLTVWRFLKRKDREFKQKPLIPEPLLDGHELIKMGFTPGPIFGKIHREMVDMQMDGKLKNKSQAKKWVRNK